MKVTIFENFPVPILRIIFFVKPLDIILVKE